MGWKAYSPNGAPIYGEWKVVDARNVKFRDAESEDEREFQGRDRKTLNSQAQVFKIADELKPELLSADNYADRGAPIYNAQGNPVAGNGRTLAVQTAYGLLPNASARALENGKAYRAFVEKFAKENGVEISEDAKEFPLLVREFHQSELTEGEIAKDTNRDVKAEYSRAEAANENSEYFGRFVKHWNPGTNGDPRVEQNREFMQKFFRAIGKESSGAIIDGATGQYTEHAAEIVNDAALAWVIGDVSLTSQLFKNRLFFGGAFSGLYSMAYRLAPLRGTQYDLRNPLQSALKNYASLKRSREKLPAGKVMTWEEFKNQSEFGFVEESKLTAEEEASADILVQLFDDYSDRRKSGVARVLSSYANVADAFNSGEADLIGGGANPLPSSLLRHADAALRGNKLPDDGNTFFGSLYDRDIAKEQKTGKPELKNPATMFQSGANARQIVDAVMNEKAIVVPQTRLSLVAGKEQREIAKELYSKLLLTRVKTVDGRDVRFTNTGLKELRSHSANPNTLQLIPALKEIISSAHLFLTERNKDERKKNVLFYHSYARKISIGGEEFIARVVIREDVDGALFYDGEATEIEKIKELKNQPYRKPNAGEDSKAQLYGNKFADFVRNVNAFQESQQRILGNARQIDEADTQLVLDAVKNVFPEGVNVRVVDDVKAAIASAREWRTQNAIFNSELEEFKAGTHKGVLHLGVPGAILRASGLNTTEITIKESVLRKHLKKHEISVEDVRNLPEALNNPLMVYEWGTKARSLIVITNFTLSDGRKITAAVKLERSGKSIEVNELSSVHGKSIERLLEDAVEKEPGFGKNKLKYVEKDKATEWLSLASAPLAVARQSAQRLRLIEIIENFENPSTEIREQRAFHGSPHNFAAEENAPLGRFRDNKMGSGEGAQAFGWGHYLTSEEKIAREQYAERLGGETDVFYTPEIILHEAETSGLMRAVSERAKVSEWRLGFFMVDFIRFWDCNEKSINGTARFIADKQKPQAMLEVDRAREDFELLKENQERIIKKYGTLREEELQARKFAEQRIADAEAFYDFLGASNLNELLTEELKQFIILMKEPRRHLYTAEFDDAALLDWTKPLTEEQEDRIAAELAKTDPELAERIFASSEEIAAAKKAYEEADAEFYKAVEAYQNEEDTGTSLIPSENVVAARERMHKADNKAKEAKWRLDRVKKLRGSELSSIHKAMRGPNEAKTLSKAFFRAGFVGHKFPAASMGIGNYTKGTNYVIYDESALNIVDKVSWLKNARGKVFGAYNSMTKEVFIAKNARIDTVLHELGWHAMFDWASANAPEFHAKMREYAANAPEAIKAQVRKAYPDLNEQSEAFLDEVGAHAFSLDHYGKIEDLLKTAKDKTWWGKVKRLFQKIWKAFSKALGKSRVDLSALSKMDYKDAIAQWAEDFVNGKRLQSQIGGDAEAQRNIFQKTGENEWTIPASVTEAVPELRGKIVCDDDAYEHIAARHLGDITRMGYSGVREFVEDMIANIVAVYDKGNGYDLLAETGRSIGTGGRVLIYLKKSENGDFYDVGTAHPVKIRRYENKKPIWRRTHFASAVANLNSRMNFGSKSDYGNDATGRRGNVNGIRYSLESYRGNAEAQRIEAESKANGTWLKAPNGKPSKLNPRQWLQVRTKAFKKWFGDWENVAKKKQLNSLVIAEVAKGSFKPVAGKTPIESAVDWAEAHKEEVETVIGKVLFDGKSTKQSFSHTRYQNKYDVLPAVPKILRYGVYLGAMPDKDGATILNHYFCGRVKIGEAEHIVFVRARDAQGGSGRFYVHEVFTEEEIKKSDGKFKQGEAMQTPPAKTNPSDLYRSIIYPVLSVNEKDVSKVVDENGEPLVVYHGSKASFNAFSHEFAMRNGAMLGRGFYFTTDEEYASGFGGNVFSVFLNLKNPLHPAKNKITKEDLKRVIRFIDPTGETVADYASSSKGYPGKAWYENALNEAVDAIFSTRKNYSQTSDSDIIGELFSVWGQEDALRGIIEGLGYDGFIPVGTFSDDFRIVFLPAQIKSATDNVGTFDAGNADIRYQREEAEGLSPAERQFEAEKAAGVKYLHWTAKKRIQQGAMALAWKLMTLGRQMPNLDDVRAVYPYETNGFVLRETRNVAKAYMEIIKARGKDISKMSLIEAEPVLVAAAKEFHGRETREKIRNIAAVDGEAVYTAIESVARENQYRRHGIVFPVDIVFFPEFYCINRVEVSADFSYVC